MPTCAMIRQSLPILTVVSDLNQIVDLRSGADDGVVDAAAIDRRVRADLDVVADDASPDVRNLRMRAIREHVPESI